MGRRYGRQRMLKLASLQGCIKVFLSFRIQRTALKILRKGKTGFRKDFIGSNCDFPLVYKQEKRVGDLNENTNREIYYSSNFKLPLE